MAMITRRLFVASAAAFVAVAPAVVRASSLMPVKTIPDTSAPLILEHRDLANGSVLRRWNSTLDKLYGETVGLAGELRVIASFTDARHFRASVDAPWICSQMSRIDGAAWARGSDGSILIIPSVKPARAPVPAPVSIVISRAQKAGMVVGAEPPSEPAPRRRVLTAPISSMGRHFGFLDPKELP
jgi:hypothetical protein